MKLSRSNYTLIAAVGIMLSVGAASVVLADDSANAAANGVDLRKPAGACANEQQLPRQLISTIDFPMKIPTQIPTDTPTEIPTDTPTEIPTDTPTEIPSDTPTEIPSEFPSEIPTGIVTTTAFVAGEFANVVGQLRKAFAKDDDAAKGCSNG